MPKSVIIFIVICWHQCWSHPHLAVMHYIRIAFFSSTCWAIFFSMYLVTIVNHVHTVLENSQYHETHSLQSTLFFFFFQWNDAFWLTPVWIGFSGVGSSHFTLGYVNVISSLSNNSIGFLFLSLESAPLDYSNFWCGMFLVCFLGKMY